MCSRTRCVICDSPDAANFHFGARSCKACAAFFRRTVALDVKYKCVAEGTQHEGECRIHHEIRMICRRCRFNKCLRAKMTPSMVQKQRCKSKASRRSAAAAAAPPDERVELQQIHSDSSPSSSNMSPGVIVAGPYAPDQNNIDAYRRSLVSAEKALWDRRRLLYTLCSLDSMFTEENTVPFTRANLRPLVITEFNGLGRPELLMLFDYARDLEGFNQLSKCDKGVMYAMIASVDVLLGSGYLTALLGTDEGIVILTDGRYIPMDPLPFRGDEPECAEMFSNPDTLHKYRLTMPTHIKLYTDVVPLFRDLQMTFDEFAAFKAMLIWTIADHRLTEDGKILCGHQLDSITTVLKQLTARPGEARNARYDQFMHVMCSVIELAIVMVEGFVRLAFFELASLDPIVYNMVEKAVENGTDFRPIVIAGPSDRPVIILAPRTQHDLFSNTQL